MRLAVLALSTLPFWACTTNDDALRLRHGSPLYTYKCDGGQTFQSRQIISGEVEVTAGGRTLDVTDANGDPVAVGPRLETVGDAMRLTRMPGGPYENCRIDMGSE